MIRSFRTSGFALPALLLMALLWGSTFVVTKDAVVRIPAADLTFLRFGVALIALAALAPRALRMSVRTLRQGLVLGGLFTLGQLPQASALEGVDASVAGFATGLSMVLTPVLGWLVFRHRVSAAVWAAVALATAGLAILAVQPAAGAPGAGHGWHELALVLSAVGFAAHVVTAGHVATPRNALSLTLVQTAVVTLTSGGFAVSDGLTVPAAGGDWLALLHLGLVCGALTLFLQIWAQSHVEATRAAVVMGTEPLWAAAFAVVLGGEPLTWRLVAGGVAVMLAIHWVVVPPGRRRGAAPRATPSTGSAQPERRSAPARR